MRGRLICNETLRPDGRKKAYVRLTADHDALDVANKVRRAVHPVGSLVADCLCFHQIGFI